MNAPRALKWVGLPNLQFVPLCNRTQKGDWLEAIRKISNNWGNCNCAIGKVHARRGELISAFSPQFTNFYENFSQFWCWCSQILFNFHNFPPIFCNFSRNFFPSPHFSAWTWNMKIEINSSHSPTVFTHLNLWIQGGIWRNVLPSFFDRCFWSPRNPHCSGFKEKRAWFGRLAQMHKWTVWMVHLPAAFCNHRKNRPFCAEIPQKMKQNQTKRPGTSNETPGMPYPTRQCFPSPQLHVQPKL